jgi:hypothetical protein
MRRKSWILGIGNSVNKEFGLECDEASAVLEDDGMMIFCAICRKWSNSAAKEYVAEFSLKLGSRRQSCFT